MHTLEARIKETNEYNWFRFAGKRPLDVVHGNGKTTVTLKLGDVFGLRVSSSGKQYRMVAKKTGLTKVFTVSEAEQSKLLRLSVKVRNPNVAYKVDATSKNEPAGSFKTNWSPMETKLLGLLRQSDNGLELEQLRIQLAGKAWDDLHVIPKSVDQAINNLIHSNYAKKLKRKGVTLILPHENLNQLHNSHAGEYTMDNIVTASMKLADLGIEHEIVIAKTDAPKFKSFKAFSGSLKTQAARKYAQDYYVWVVTGRKGAAPKGSEDPKTYQLWKYIRASIQQILKNDEKKKAAKK